MMLLQPTHPDGPFLPILAKLQACAEYLDINPAGKGGNGDVLLEDGCPLERGPKEAREKRPRYRWSWERSGRLRKDPAALGSTEDLGGEEGLAAVSE